MAAADLITTVTAPFDFDYTDDDMRALRQLQGMPGVLRAGTRAMHPPIALVHMVPNCPGEQAQAVAAALAAIPHVRNVTVTTQRQGAGWAAPAGPVVKHRGDDED